jgi:hypothetical protein
MTTTSELKGQPPPQSARSVFLAWEILRLVFNAALLLIVLVVGHLFVTRESLGHLAFWRFMAMCAVGANVCFSLGPIGEGYLALLGVRRSTARLLLFLVGLIVSVVLTIALLSMWRLRTF